jgi:hypothetical protein
MQEEILSPLKDNKWQALDFPDSATMLYVVNPILREGILNSDGRPTHLHKWQRDIHLELCEAKPTSKHPYKFCLCASNGSGKDAYIVTPFVVWFICCKVQALVILTSSSGVQLSNQTENLIRNYCKEVNEFFIQIYGAPILHIKQRHIECILSGSVMYFFATDEEGKAEGYHPMTPNSEMAIVVNEAKSVEPKIFRALKRCTGFNYWINVSTPGEPVGDFYESFENWPHKHRIDYNDCPHLSPEEYEEDKKILGEHSPLFRSKWLALFTFIGGKYVIPQGSLERLRKRNKVKDVPELFSNREKRIGIDIALSSGGDETTISGFKGNKQTDLYTIREQNAIKLADKIEMYLLITANVKKNHPYINADDGGVGRAVIDILRSRGWMINRVLNQSPALNKSQYRNRGAEIWFRFARFIEEGLLILKDDDKLYSQLASRKYKEDKAAIEKLTLQNKKEMIAEGLPSPDRADATVLALKDYDIKEYLAASANIGADEEKKKIDPIVRIQELENRLWEMEKRKSNKEHSHYSLGSVLGKKEKEFSKFYAN